MKRLPFFATCAVLAAIAVPAAAQVQQFKAKDLVTVDPGLAYAVIRTNLGTDLKLFKLVDEADRKSWEVQRQAAYEKARKKYERDLRNYERDIKDWNGSESARREMRGVKPTKPVEVTLESTAVTPIEMANFQTIFRGRQIAQDADNVRSFLVALKPGTYVIYGGAGLPGAIGVGSCFCMGSVAFAAQAGQIIDAGTVKASVGDWYRPVDYVPPPAKPGVPAQLAGRQVAPAKLVAAGKMANFFGTPVTRLNPVPGVLGYDRDIPLDMASGNRPVPAIR
jgi:hypothetical protein